MGLRELAINAAKTAFTVAGNVPRSCTFRSKTLATAGYTASNGTVSDPYTDHAVSMIFGSFKTTEIDGQAIRLSDVKGLLPSIYLSVDPKENDIVIENGTTYEIIKIKTDPAGAMWVLQLRKP